ncbi:MAG: hypothetical protein ACXWLG_05725, partial [Myxococcaceae bacterium]
MPILRGSDAIDDPARPTPRRFSSRAAFVLLVAILASVHAPEAREKDPLPSWNDGSTRSAIVGFVEKVTRKGSPDFVPPAERIATFDNDGTLWAEKPFYVQALFALERVKVLAPQHPEWKDQEPFASVLRGDLPKVLAGGEKSLVELLMATHAGMSTEEFERIVKDWIATARHPTTKPGAGELHRRQGWQAGGHQRGHRASAGGGIRE